MLNTEKLDRLQKRLEFWDRPGNPITVNDGLELVALARKGLEAERLETLLNGYKVATEESLEITGELRSEVARLNREADWLAQQFRDCPDEVDQEAYWHICKREDCKGWGKEDVAACWRRAAREAVEASHA